MITGATEDQTPQCANLEKKEVIKPCKIHPLGTTNDCTKSSGNPVNSWWDVWVAGALHFSIVDQPAKYQLCEN